MCRSRDATGFSAPTGTPPIIICVNYKRGGALELFKQGPRQGDLLTGLKPDTKFTYRIESPGNGRLKVYACLGDVDKLPTTPQFAFPFSAFTETSGLYFKAGAGPACVVETAAARGQGPATSPPRRAGTYPQDWSLWRRRHQHQARIATTNVRRRLERGHNDLPREYLTASFGGAGGVVGRRFESE
jgi:hypothetical protein